MNYKYVRDNMDTAQRIQPKQKYQDLNSPGGHGNIPIAGDIKLYVPAEASVR